MAPDPDTAAARPAWFVEAAFGGGTDRHWQLKPREHGLCDRTAEITIKNADSSGARSEACEFDRQAGNNSRVPHVGHYCRDNKLADGAGTAT